MARADRSPGHPAARHARVGGSTSRRAHAFPAGCTVLLMLLAAAPLGMPTRPALLPAVDAGLRLLLVAVPPRRHAAAGGVRCSALLLDLLGYLPLGVGVLTLLAVHGLALRAGAACWRGSGFLLVWLAFVRRRRRRRAAGLGADIAAACSACCRPRPALFQAVLTVALYPALAVLFIRAHRARSPTRSAPEHEARTPSSTGRLHPPRPAADGRPGRACSACSAARLYQVQVRGRRPLRHAGRGEPRSAPG